MRAYERFLDYAKIYTTSDDHSTSHPSTASSIWPACWKGR